MNTNTLEVNDYLEYGLSHDEFDASLGILRRWKQAQDPTLCWQQPIAFGPMPGAQPHQLLCTGSRTAVIVFKTSATYLRALLPSSAYSLELKDTVAFASFRLQTLDDKTSPDQIGRHTLGLYLHNVQYSTKASERVTGDYLPILFEDLTRPTTTGPENIGLPMVHTNISVETAQDRYAATMSYGDQVWARLAWSRLEKTKDTAALVGSKVTVLVHRYIPGIGKGPDSLPDADYAVMCPTGQSDSRTETSSRRSSPNNATCFTFDGHDDLLHPQLRHIASRLSEMPIFEVVQSFVEENASMPDLGALVRIEST